MPTKAKPRFPARVFFGFNPKGKRVTVGYLYREDAKSDMLFAYAFAAFRRRHTEYPKDDIEAKAAGWFVASRRLEKS